MDGGRDCIPGWRIVREIGKGSFGTVYEIEKEGDFGSGVRSALKVISIPESQSEIAQLRNEGYDQSSMTELFKSRVEDITSEFRLMNKLKGSSNVVSFEDFLIIQHDDDPGYDVMIRMELLTSLPDHVRMHFETEPITDAIVCRVGVDICSALELCHANSIIHRDIKPQNIFVNAYGVCKLGDFGIAKISDHTASATKTGTFGYMAPEVYLSRPYNASIDIYSLGLVLYWMLNERRGPFLPLPPAVPKSAQNAEALERRMSGEPLPAPKHGSEALKRIVLKACAFDPKDRYANPTEMKRDLESAADTDTDGSILPVIKQDPEKQEHSEEEPGEKTIGLFGDRIPGREPDASDKNSHDRIIGKISPVAPEKETFSDPQITDTTEKTPLPEEQSNRNKRIPIIPLIAAIAALIVIALLIILDPNETKKEKCSASLPAASQDTPVPAASQDTPVPVTPEPAEDPTPEPVTEPKILTIDDYFSSMGYWEGERYADDSNRFNDSYGLKYMWRTCYFGPNGQKYTGPIIINGVSRDNAIAFVFQGKSTKTDTAINQRYDGGYIELQNPDRQYDSFELCLGALSEPDQWYGPGDDYGYYRMVIKVDGKTQINTGWRDCYELSSYTVDISGANSIRIYIDASVGNTGGSPNPGIYDVQFVKYW